MLQSNTFMCAELAIKYSYTCSNILMFSFAPHLILISNVSAGTFCVK